MIPSERASEEEQNGANFSFTAPSGEDLLVWKEITSKPWTIVHAFFGHHQHSYKYMYIYIIYIHVPTSRGRYTGVFLLLTLAT